MSSWQGILHHLLADQLRPSQTGLDNVKELLPGFRLSIDSPDSQIVWNPRDYCAPISSADLESVSKRLRQTVDFCIGSWTSRYDRVVLGVSGGLDSSVVAASVVGAAADLSCLTLATEDAIGDERHYARQLTNYLGVDLHEFIEDPTEIDLASSSAAHLPRPVARSFAQSGDKRNMEVAAAIGAKAFFSGAGGDNIFCYLQSVAPVVDRIRMQGFSRGPWRTANDLSKLTGASVWKIAGRSALRAHSKQSQFPWPVNRSFLNAQADMSIEIDHPWLACRSGLLPGKAAHIGLLLNIQNHVDGFNREHALPVISPLLSQPLVELCLSIPAWLWIDGGWNRAPARAAYSGALPTSLIHRRSKGTPDGFVIQIFERNRSLIREMLLDGALSSQGLLDRGAIKQALATDAPVRDLRYWRLMKLIDVEAWLRSWLARM